MGYLELPSGISNFSKAVISLWFRVPAASISAAVAQYNAASVFSDNSDLNLPGVIPLITFGPTNEEAQLYNGSGDLLSTNPISPCVIGVYCGEREFGDGTILSTPVMYARLQYSSGARALSLTSPVVTDIYNDFFQVGARHTPCNTYSTPAVTNGLSIPVSADAWHHILVSFDLSTACSTTATGSSPFIQFNSLSNFWWAFDDVNKNGDYLWPSTPRVYGATPVDNGIVSDWCFSVLNGAYNSHSFSAGNIPTSGKSIGVPSSAGNVSKIYDVKMAELQVFTGITLDTSVTENRRLFIGADGRPVDPSVAAQALVKAPDILLHGSNNWKNGVNTGSLGNFTRTGTINPFAAPGL